MCTHNMFHGEIRKLINPIFYKKKILHKHEDALYGYMYFHQDAEHQLILDNKLPYTIYQKNPILILGMSGFEI